MRSRTLSLFLLIAAAIALILLSPSCGSRTGADGSSSLFQGTGALPGTVGTLGRGNVSAGDLAVPQPITNGSPSAPLGTSPAYNTQQGGAIVTPVHEGSRTASTLEPGQLFRLIRITLAPKGTTPNWSTTSFLFNEGDTVDFYAEYEVAANVQFTRKWSMDFCNLEYAEPPETNQVAGTYRAMFRFTIPYGSANDNADFNFEAFYGTRTTSSKKISAALHERSLVVLPPADDDNDGVGTDAQQQQGDVTAQLVSKNTSVVVGPQDPPNFNIIDITMMPDGIAPDWSLGYGQFTEGQNVDLWIKYEMLNHQMTIDRHWFSPDLNLDQTDSGIVTPQGTYEVKLDWMVPIGLVKNNCVFQYDLTSGNIHKVSSPFYFDVGMGQGAGEVTQGSPPQIFNYTSTDPGIFCGHIDVDTSHLIYPPSKGTTDGHIHEWDDKFDLTWVNYFDMKTTTLHNIQRDVASTQKFKIIVSNANLSPGARLVINQTYNENDPSTYIPVTTYDDIPLNQLPIYSLGGVAGTTKLTTFEVHYLTTAIASRQVIPTVTGSVRGNIPGKNGETRNGALTIQAVKVNADGTNAFTTNLAQSNGGVQGTAATGLAWESTTFWHWGGPAYNQAGWDTYDPSKDYTCVGGSTTPPPSILASGQAGFRVMAATGMTRTDWPSGATSSIGDGRVARMCWEDLNNSGDFDYNEFVGDLQSTEWRNSSGALKQIQLYVKARARGNSDTTKSFQFNMDGAFPGANGQALVDTYYDNENSDLTDDSRHGNQVVWNSSNGINFPVFPVLKDALPKPTDSSATTNAISGTTFVKGDYAIVTITFDAPVAANNYSAAPYNPELRVQQGTNAAYVYHLWRKKGDALLSTGYPSGGFIVPATIPWMLDTKKIDTAYPAFDTWAKWLALPALDDPRDPNVYLTGGTPAIGASIFGDPQTKAYWTGATGQTDFHTQVTGEMDTLTLLKYLNGDSTVTSQSLSKEVLLPCQHSYSYDTHLPLRLTHITATGSDGYNDYKTYVNNGVATNKPMDYQLGAQLLMLVLNVERGHVKPNEWVWCPEIGEIRPIVSDPAHMSTRKGLIAEANAAFALPAGTANDAKRQMWRDILSRVNANSYIIQQQYWAEPTPRWYENAPVSNTYFLRSLFKP